MNTDRAVELQEYAWTLQAEGRLDEAFKACREALQLIEADEGPDSPDAANILNDLAEIEKERQNFEAAVALAERARAILDALGDRFTGETAMLIRLRTLNLLGEIRRVQGDYACAEVDLDRALTTAVGEFGDVSEEAAEARNNLAVLYKYWGRFKEARRLYEEALRVITAIHGASSLEAGVIFHNIGGVLHAQGDFSAAEEPGRKAWDISRQLLGEDDTRTVIDASAYASILDGLERYDESETIYRHALTVLQRAFGPDHYEVAANLHNLAAVLAVRGHLVEAEQHYRRALEVKDTLLGEESPDAALTRNNLGRLLNQAGRPGEGVPLLQKAVTILEKRLAPEHPHLAAARRNLQEALSSLSVTRQDSPC